MGLAIPFFYNKYPLPPITPSPLPDFKEQKFTNIIPEFVISVFLVLMSTVNIIQPPPPLFFLSLTFMSRYHTKFPPRLFFATFFVKKIRNKPDIKLRHQHPPLFKIIQDVPEVGYEEILYDIHGNITPKLINLKEYRLW